jgi:hypothetical protein
MPRRSFLALALLPLLAASSATADEGMWPFNMVPVAQIQKDHGVTLTPEWLDHLRLSSVRLNVGGSGSFVSSRGLVLTNHHVASDCIAKIATPTHDYLATGYVAGKDGPEVPCPDLEVNELVSIAEVTAEVKAARQPGMNDAQANVAMKGAMSQIEKRCADAAGPAFRCDVVTLYGGGKYDLYKYQRFSDVRLVFAPEADVAFFGGDPENFTYPRYDVDMALFRIYGQDGQPVHPAAWLKWEPAGPSEGDTVFVSGHPGRTDRMRTAAQLETLRDVVYPYVLEFLGREREALQAFADFYGPEGKREIREHIFGIQNSEKGIGGMLRGLRDPAIMRKKRDEEAALRAAVAKDPQLAAQYGSTWDDIGRVQAIYKQVFNRYVLLESTPGELAAIARDLVRAPAELSKPNADRLREYRDSALPSLEQKLFSDAPVYGNVEAVTTRLWLERLARDLPEAARAVLGGETPARRAAEMVAGTRLSDVNVRRALWGGGQAAVDASTDPLVVAMRTIDEGARAVRKRYDDEIEGPMRSASQRIAAATFAASGTSVYPDATFTLRLSIGTVRGYRDNGRDVAWATDLAGMYAHATGKQPLALPQRWLDAKANVDGHARLDFVSTDDTTGGNSGSPVVNAAGNLIGLLFDGNITSLANTIAYSDVTARSVSVDTQAMLEVLRHVYGADALVAELLQ